MPKTLLLADDSVTIQKVVGISFANEDVLLLTVDNGDDAIAKARETRPDLVLADVVMPGKSGYEVCEAVKADPNLAGVPVLLLTGTFEAFDEALAKRAGADGHITKPFEAQALVDQVNSLLARSATRAPVPTPTSSEDSLERPSNNESVQFFDDETTSPSTTQPGAAPVANDIGFADSSQSFSFDDTPDLGAALEAPLEPSASPAPKVAGEETRILPAGVDLSDPADATLSAEELEAQPIFDALDETGPRVAPVPAATLDPAQARAYDVSSTDLGPAIVPPPIPGGDETLLVAGPLVTAPEPVPTAAPVAMPPPIPEPPAAAPAFSAPQPEPATPPPAPVPEFSAPQPEPSQPVAAPEPSQPVAAPEPSQPVAAPEPSQPIAAPEPSQPIAAPEPSQPIAAPAATVAAPLAPSQPPSVASGELPLAMRDEIRATLEKVAWEAFGRVTESVVKDAVERIEKVAWEVVPQLAETLVQEEIRKLKDS